MDGGVYDRDGCAPEPRCLKYHGCHEAWRGLMLRFGLLMCVCLFFLGCALLFAFGSTGSPCFVPRGIRTLPGPRLSAANLSLSLFRTPRSSRLPRSSKLYLGPLIRTAWTRIVGIDSQDSQEIEDKRNHRSQRKTSMMDGIFL